MKKKKLFVFLIVIILISLFSIAASFRQCGLNILPEPAMSEEVNADKTDENGTADSDAADNASSNTTNEATGDTAGDADNITNNTNNTNDTNDTNNTYTGNGGSQESTVPETTSKNDGQTGQPAKKFAIVISGASYNRQQYGWFLGSSAMAYKLLKSSGYTDENVCYLFEDENEPDVDYLSTLSNFKKAVEDISSRSGIADTILVIIIGHGGLNGADSYYRLSDSNLYDTEMAEMFKGIIRDKLIFVFSPCNSGGFVDNLSGENTVIITSTRKDEANRAAFIEPFLAAFDGSGDADSNGKVSFAEAFNYASANVKQQYSGNGWGILSEHAQLDDNGDKISTEILVPDGKDGGLAGQIYLK